MEFGGADGIRGGGAPHIVERRTEMRKQKTDWNAVLPDLQEIDQERRRLRYRQRYRKALMSTISVLVIVASVAVLISTLYMPVFQVAGTSMTPSLNEGDIVIGIKTEHLECGQVCGMYYNNKLLLKRAIAFAGSWVNIDAQGYVYVDGIKLEEPYVTDRDAGICDIEYPYQVPDGCVFVLGDHRSTSIDSRSSVIGCVPLDELVGRIVFRVWPLKSFGTVA